MTHATALIMVVLVEGLHNLSGPMTYTARTLWPSICLLECDACRCVTTMRAMLRSMWTLNTLLPAMPTCVDAYSVADPATLLRRHLRFVSTRGMSVPFNDYVY